MSADAVAGSFLHAVLASGTPVAFAALGEVVAERSGVLNLGVEGMMLVGAVAGFAAGHATGSSEIGFLCGMAAGGALALVHAGLCVTLRANQVASGLALAILGPAIASYVGRPYTGETAPPVAPVSLGLFSEIPVLGEGLFRHAWPVYAAALLAGLLWGFLRWTRPGLRLQIAGESPETADALGVPVAAYRYVAVIVGGMLAGAGGATLSLFETRSWAENLTAGKGWIALAMVVFGSWGPVRSALGAYLFGGLTALQLRLQAFGAQLPAALLDALPYVLTLALLVLYSALGGRRPFAAPLALGRPYRRESPW